MKQGITPKKSMAKWWAVSLLIIFVLEVSVCVLLFIPQNQALADVAQRRGALEKQNKEIARIPARLDSIRKETQEVDQRLIGAKLFTTERAQVAIMKAVAAANMPTVMVLSLTPVKPPETPPKPADEKAAPPPVPTEAWLVRVKGRFGDLVIFLNKLEQEGILLDSTNFEADGIKQRGIIELSVAAKVCSPEDVANAIAQAQKAAAVEPAAK